MWLSQAHSIISFLINFSSPRHTTLSDPVIITGVVELRREPKGSIDSLIKELKGASDATGKRKDY